MGGIYVMLGYAAVRAGVAGLRARSKARFDSLLRRG
jgi:hypothetical protein